MNPQDRVIPSDYRSQIAVMHEALEQQKKIQLQLLQKLRETMEGQVPRLPASPLSQDSPQKSPSPSIGYFRPNLYASPAPTESGFYFASSGTMSRKTSGSTSVTSALNNLHVGSQLGSSGTLASTPSSERFEKDGRLFPIRQNSVESRLSELRSPSPYPQMFARPDLYPTVRPEYREPRQRHDSVRAEPHPLNFPPYRPAQQDVYPPMILSTESIVKPQDYVKDYANEFRDRTISEPVWSHQRSWTSNTIVQEPEVWQPGRTNSINSLHSDATLYQQDRVRSLSDALPQRSRSLTMDLPTPASKTGSWNTKSKSYRCNICGAPFSCSGGLSRHRRIHTNRRSYACSVPGCDRTFNRVDNCKTHELAHRKRMGMDPTPCPIVKKREPGNTSEEEILEVETGSILDLLN